MEFGTREHAIQAYENIVKRWNRPGNDIKELLPKEYERICRILKDLKLGREYKVVDRTKDLVTSIAYVAGQIPGINVKKTYQNEAFIDIENTITYNDAAEITKELNKSLDGMLYKKEFRYE